MLNDLESPIQAYTSTDMCIYVSNEMLQNFVYNDINN